MKLLLINPIVRYHDEPRHIPLGELQLLAILERDYPKISFVLYDANAYRVDDFWRGKMYGLDEVLQADDFDVIAIGGLITAYNYIKAAIKRSRELQPHAKIVAGGGFLSAIPTDIMDLIPDIDYGVVGEAYRTLPELLPELDAGVAQPERVDGIVYRTNDGLQFTNPRELIPDLDWLPFPAYKYAPLDIYFRNSGILMSEEAMKAKKRLDYNFSLSCPYLCRFCWDLGITSNLKYTTREGRIEPTNARPGKNSVVRQHSPQYIGRLIEHMRKDFLDVTDDKRGIVDPMPGYPVDFIAWFDENIVAHDAQTGFTWLKEIVEELWKRDLIADCLKKGVRHDSRECNGIHFGGTMHAGLARKETLTTMKRIGFVYGDYGLESWSRAILQDLGKGSSPERNEAAIKMTLEAGMAPIPNQIIGFPLETWQTIYEMLDAWERTGIATVPFICLPAGTQVRSNPSTKPIERLNVGECVQTHRIRYRPILECFEHDYQGELVMLVAGDLPVRLTPNHPVYAISRRKRTFDKRDGRTYPEETVAEAVSRYEPSWVRADSLKVGDIVLRPINRSISDVQRLNVETKRRYPANTKRFSDGISCDENLMRLCGYYLAEGHILRNADGIAGVFFSFHNEETLYHQDVKQICSKLGLDCLAYERPEDHSMQIGFCSALLGRWFHDNFGEHASGKRIPEWAMTLPLSKQGELVKGYFWGDGYTDKMGFEMTSNNEGLLRQLRDVLLRFNVFGRLRLERRKHQMIVKGSMAKFGEAYSLSVTGQYQERFGAIVSRSTRWRLLGKRAQKSGSIVRDGFAYIAIRLVSRENYSGKVYNISVADDHSYVIERLGAVKNCTPYPGAQWFTEYRDDIVRQYGGDFEAFLRDLEDATKVTAVINKNFTPAELVGIQQIMGTAAKSRDFNNARRLLKLSEQKWSS